MAASRVWKGVDSIRPGPRIAAHRKANSNEWRGDPMVSLAGPSPERFILPDRLLAIRR